MVSGLGTGQSAARKGQFRRLRASVQAAPEPKLGAYEDRAAAIGRTRTPEIEEAIDRTSPACFNPAYHAVTTASRKTGSAGCETQNAA